MCVFGNGGAGAGGNRPKVAPVSPPPNKGKVIEAGTTAATVAPANITAIETARAALLKRQGIFGNIKTSPTGDTGYGRSSFSGGYATFGSGQ